MTSARVSFAELMAFARKGAPFKNDQIFVYFEGEEDPDPTAMFGHGFDFSELISVSDRAEGKLVDALAQLRIIATVGGELYLRAWLKWATSSGDEHKSFACYTLSEEAAGSLDDSPPADPTLGVTEQSVTSVSQAVAALDSIMSSTMAQAAQYEATWEQTFPGSDTNWELEILETEAAAIAAAADYHSKVVLEAVANNPLLLCMISDTNFGLVQPDEPSKLLEWVKMQPQFVA